MHNTLQDRQPSKQSSQHECIMSASSAGNVHFDYSCSTLKRKCYDCKVYALMLPHEGQIDASKLTQQREDQEERLTVVSV